MPATQLVRIHQLLVSAGALVAGLAYLIGLATDWKKLSKKSAAVVGSGVENIFDHGTNLS